jgi:ligand-binding sensor domain-containing protein/signal transduction histidine kinase
LNPPPTFRILFFLHLWVAGFALPSTPVEGAERYVIDGWETDRGLPQNVVRCIAQTPDGFLWCGTPAGMVRFDGLRFQLFNATNTPALGSARIRQLLAARSGALWISTEEGALIEHRNGDFRLAHPESDEGSRQGYAGIAEDEHGQLWLSTETGAIKRFRGNSLTEFAPENPRALDFLIQRDHVGRIWLRNRLQLARIFDGTPQPVLDGPFGQYQFLAPSRTEGWWIRMGGLVRRWSSGVWPEERAAPAWGDRAVTCALEDQNGQLWIGSRGLGLFRYGPDGSVETFSSRNGLGSDLIYCLHEDAEGNLWVGTHGGGLRRIRRAALQVFGREQGITSGHVTSLAEGPNSSLWVGTENDGLFRLEKGKATLLSGSKRLTIRSVLQTADGQVWIGTSPGGLLKLENGQLEPGAPPTLEPLAPESHVYSLLEDSAKRLWVGTLGATALPFRQGAGWNSVALPPDRRWDVVAMAEDASGTLWIGTDGQGLLRWDGNQWNVFNRSHGLPSATLRSLFASKDGALWIGTEGGGISRFKNGVFSKCSSRHGLPDDSIQFITEDFNRNLWMSSFQGVFSLPASQTEAFFSGTTPRISPLTLSTAEGLPSLECTGGFQPSGLMDRHGKLWIPTFRGLALIDPTKPRPPLLPPAVYLEAIAIDGAQEDLGRTAFVQNALRSLTPGRHRCEIRYSAVQLTAPGRVRFRYRMQGVDPDWVDAGSRRIAIYSVLPPGDHRFEVQARVQDGQWSPSLASVQLLVPPLFWERPGFLWASGLSAAALIAFFARNTTRRRFQARLRQLEAQRQLEAERTRIAQDIHDDLGAGLTQIGWLGSMTEKNPDHSESVRTHARKISATAREMVRSLDEIVWAVRPENDSLQALLDYFGHRVDEFSENSPIRVWFPPPASIPELIVPAEVRHNFYLSCKECLNNALKHSQASEIRITLQILDQQLQAEIRDNGRGFSQESSRGNGLPNMRRRIQSLGGSFELTSTPQIGTVVRICVPLPAANPTSPPLKGLP